MFEVLFRPLEYLSTRVRQLLTSDAAFDKAVVSSPPFETVIHTASPFHFNVTDTKRDLLDPAVNGTTGILKAIHAHVPTVKRVVITSSFAAIVDPSGKPDGYVSSFILSEHPSIFWPRFFCFHSLSAIAKTRPTRRTPRKTGTL